MPRLVLVLAVLAAATLLGFWWRARNGRFTAVERSVLDRAASLDVAGVTESTAASSGGPATTSGPGDPTALTPDQIGSPLGSTATFLQLSSEVCAPCRRTHGVLAALAGERDGVVHVDLDVAQHLDLVRRFDVLRTPTVLLLDPHGRVAGRMSGATSRAQAVGALDHLARATEAPIARAAAHARTPEETP